MPRPPTPPPIVIPNCIQVALHWTHPGGRFSNVIHGNLTAVGPLNPALAETLFSAFKANAQISAWITTWVHETVSFTGVSIKDMRAGNNPTLLSTGIAAAGGNVNTVLPVQTALVVTHRTAQSGKAFRGRTYVGGLSDTAMDDSRTFDSLAGSAAVSFLNGINSVMQAQQFPMVIAHEHLLQGTDKHGNVLADRPAGVVPITGFDVANPRIDTQRRRLGR